MHLDASLETKGSQLAERTSESLKGEREEECYYGGPAVTTQRGREREQHFVNKSVLLNAVCAQVLAGDFVKIQILLW